MIRIHSYKIWTEMQSFTYMVRFDLNVFIFNNPRSAAQIYLYFCGSPHWIIFWLRLQFDCVIDL